MRLIKTKKLVDSDTILFEVFAEGQIPEYAILSHTWEKNQEVTFRDYKDKSYKEKKGYRKIKKICELARKQRPPIDYVWVDTCCIDKSSSAELTQAINSMFKWYQAAKVCYVHLADFEKPEGAGPIDSLTLGKCRWFRRGWTLQELIAPTNLQFCSKSWSLVGSKQKLINQISAVTRIETGVLDKSVPLSSVLVAKKMSWASTRKTTREEDMAYCLLGIFDINMPLIYGEGTKAFKRLQEEIMRSTYDLSIFAWKPVDDRHKSMYSGFLAESPADFFSCSKLVPVNQSWGGQGELTVTTMGVRLKAAEFELRYNQKHQYVLQLNCRDPETSSLGECLAVPMRKIEPQTYLRARTRPVNSEPTAFTFKNCPAEDRGYRNLMLLTKIPEPLGPRPIGSENQDLTALTRFAAVQVSIHPDFSAWNPPAFEGYPRKFWDVQDHVFFSSHGSMNNWGAISINDDTGSTMAIFLCYWFNDSHGWDCKGTLIGQSDARDWMAVWRELFLFAQEFDYRADYVLNQLSYYGVDLQRSTTSIRGPPGLSRVFFDIKKSNGRGICLEHFWKINIGLQ